MRSKQMKRRNGVREAFTLIELMVVIAIIALLVAILLPSLQSARKHAKTVACSSNMHHVGLAVANYLFTSKGTFPASYYYATDEKGNYDLNSCTDAKTYGYIHWSHFLYDSGQVGDKAFSCPEYDNGGAPRTNPGPDSRHWEQGAQMDLGQSHVANAASVEDRQATRMAITANAAIMPRNKFSRECSGGIRYNVFVKETQIRRAGGTILAGEFLNNWKALNKPNSDSGGGGTPGDAKIISASHRPVNPFYHVGGGWNEYAATNSAGFIYGKTGDTSNGAKDPTGVYGLQKTKDVRNAVGLLDWSTTVGQINALGRHHPNANKVYAEEFGGLANFLFVDSHAESMTILDTMEKRLWGDAYYSLTGANEVLNYNFVPNNGG